MDIDEQYEAVVEEIDSFLATIEKQKKKTRA